MDLTLDKTTHIGLGYATHADAFQGGREAAQTAKSQLPSGEFNLVFGFGPANVRFTDFIEGVRLVTGEETLIGIPTSHIMSTELSRPDSYFVLMIHSPSMRFSIASQEVTVSTFPMGSTSLISQFRQARGNEIRNFKYSGVLLLQHAFFNPKKPFAYHMATDLGLETWMMGGAAIAEKGHPLICRNAVVQNGAVAIECLSQQPWGIGSVSTGPFPNQDDLYREAAKSCVRESLAHMKGHPPSCGLILFNMGDDNLKKTQVILDGARSVAPNIPLIGIPTERRFIRSLGRGVKMEKESVVCLLVPA